MLDNIKHIVIVPFSNLHRPWNEKAYGEEKNRESWFRWRSDIFNKCLGQCIKHQTLMPTRTYIRMPSVDYEYFDKYLADGNLIPISYHRINEHLISSGLTENITITEIDSDDLISKNYFESIDRQLKIYPKEYTVATKGYRSDLNQIQSMFYDASPFITKYIPKNSASTTVEAHRPFPHMDVTKFEHYQNHTAEWIQIIHGKNLENKFAEPTHHRGCWAVTPSMSIDTIWFKQWAGFDMPDPKILEFNI